MSNATYNVVEPVASDWLETRDPDKDLLPSNPCCLFTHEDAYNKSIPSRTPSLQCKCAYCGKIFLINKHTAQDIIVKKRRRLYCSHACSSKSRIKRHQPYQCEMCGKTVQADEYYGEGRFCSPSCSRKYSNGFGRTQESNKKRSETLRKYYDNKLGPNRKKKRKYKKHRKSERKTHLVRHNISPEQRNAFENYRRKCRFNFTRELEECLFGEDKKAIIDDTPTKDHMISVIYGFIHDIDPYLMSHPANCMILSNSSNSSKNGSCSITIDELMERVEWFNNTILAKTEDYAKKYRKTTRHRLGNLFSIKNIHQFKMLSMIG